MRLVGFFIKHRVEYDPEPAVSKPNKQVHDPAGGLEHHIAYDIKNEEFFGLEVNAADIWFLWFVSWLPYCITAIVNGSIFWKRIYNWSVYWVHLVVYVWIVSQFAA